jgi:uncharacterized protein (DUF433 family)
MGENFTQSGKENGGKMIDWSKCLALERHPEKVSGAWVFKGTRLPVATLFENLAGGCNAAQFVDWFDGASLDQVEAVLRFIATETDIENGQR